TCTTRGRSTRRISRAISWCRTSPSAWTAAGRSTAIPASTSARRTCTRSSRRTATARSVSISIPRTASTARPATSPTPTGSSRGSRPRVAAAPTTTSSEMARSAGDDRRPAERPDPSPIARLTGVAKVYPAAGEDVRALTDVSLTIGRGEVVALLGRSGSGKTTLLNLLGTLDRPTSGSIEIDGARVESLPEESLLKLRRETLGFVFQFFHLFPYLSALENAALPLW